MALIGKIRNNTWLLILLIGFALAAFIIMDMTSSQQSLFGGGQTTLGTIAGKKVDYNKFATAESILYSGGGDAFAQKNSLWNYFVEEALVSKEAEQLGIGVPGQELKELQFGADNRLSPIISSRIRNQQTGQVDRERLNNIKSAIETNQFTNKEYRNYWAYQESEIVKDRLQAKLNAMVTKAVYTPSWMANQMQGEKNQRANFNYVRIPFDQIDDGQIELTDADFNNYLSENKAKYYQSEELRKIDYVFFNVLPSAKDTADIIKTLTEDTRKAFTEAANDSTFVDGVGSIFATYFNAEDKDPFDPRRTKDALDAAAVDTLMTMDIGTVFGPYLEEGAYKLVKLLDRQMMPDSAKCRHILISAQTPGQFAAAEKTIDSLQTLLESGAHPFDTLAANFSTDPGSAAKGGVYDFAAPTRYVPEFSDVIFFKGNIGSLYKVRTTYGVHLVEPTARKGAVTPRVKIAYYSKPIEPSKETQNKIFDDADDFLEKCGSLTKLIENAEKEGLEVETSPATKRNDFNLGLTLGSGDASRNIIKEAYKSSVGNVFPKVYRYRQSGQYYDNKYVVAGLRSIIPVGNARLDDVRADIEPLVRNIKKGDFLKGQITTNDLGAIASQYQSQIDTATNVAFSGAVQIPGLANEPAVIAAAFGQEANAISAPIVGNNGVYIVQTTLKPTPGQVTASPQDKSALTRTDQNQIQNGLMQAWKKKVSITDNRSTFF